MIRLLAVVLFLQVFISPREEFSLDVTSHELGFKIKNAGIVVKGTLSGLESVLSFNPEKPTEGSLTASVDVSTIKTGIDLRDRHLQGREYFYAEKYPRIVLRSTAVKKISKNKYSGIFTLTIRDVSKDVEIPFTYIRKGDSVTFKSTFIINRLDFGVGSESLILSDFVEVNVSVTGITRETVLDSRL